MAARIGFENEKFPHEFNCWAREAYYTHIPQPNVYYNDKEFARLAELCKGAPDLFSKAVSSALRRAGTYMRKLVRQEILKASYLDTKSISYALGRLQFYGAQVSLTVHGPNLAAHNFKIDPSRITARKGKRSKLWVSPRVKIGPGEPYKTPKKPGFSKPFMANVHGFKAMYWREKATNTLKMPRLVSPQYFAAFDQVQKPMLSVPGEIFLQRLVHEIYYRLKLK